VGEEEKEVVRRKHGGWRGKEARRKGEESPEARMERGSRKRGRTTVCLGVA